MFFLCVFVCVRFVREQHEANSIAYEHARAHITHRVFREWQLVYRVQVCVCCLAAR